MFDKRFGMIPSLDFGNLPPIEVASWKGPPRSNHVGTMLVVLMDLMIMINVENSAGNKTQRTDLSEVSHGCKGAVEIF